MQVSVGLRAICLPLEPCRSAVLPPIKSSEIESYSGLSAITIFLSAIYGLENSANIKLERAGRKHSEGTERLLWPAMHSVEAKPSL